MIACDNVLVCPAQVCAMLTSWVVPCADVLPCQEYASILADETCFCGCLSRVALPACPKSL